MAERADRAAVPPRCGECGRSDPCGGHRLARVLDFALWLAVVVAAEVALYQWGAPP